MTAHSQYMAGVIWGLSSALQPLTPIIAGQLHMSAQDISLASGLANAGYAVGTVLAVQLAQLLPQRRMLIVYAGLLVIGSASITSSSFFSVRVNLTGDVALTGPA